MYVCYCIMQNTSLYKVTLLKKINYTGKMYCDIMLGFHRLGHIRITKLKPSKTVT